MCASPLMNGRRGSEDSIPSKVVLNGEAREEGRPRELHREEAQ